MLTFIYFTLYSAPQNKFPGQILFLDNKDSYSDSDSGQGVGVSRAIGKARGQCDGQSRVLLSDASSTSPPSPPHPPSVVVRPVGGSVWVVAFRHC